MADSELQAIRERADKATPGPWEWAWNDERADGTFDAGETVAGVTLGTAGDVYGEGCVLYTERCPSCQKRWPDDPKHNRCTTPSAIDAAFIAHARADVPALLEKVRKSRDETVNIGALAQDQIDKHKAEATRLREAGNRLALMAECRKDHPNFVLFLSEEWRLFEYVLKSPSTEALAAPAEE